MHRFSSDIFFSTSLDFRILGYSSALMVRTSFHRLQKNVKSTDHVICDQDRKLFLPRDYASSIWSESGVELGGGGGVI